MGRFELTITTDYAPTWGVWEGLREVVQNGLDGKDKGYPLTVTHENGFLLVRNAHCQLDASVWLLGKSSKRGDEGQRGKHGDGLKVGTLALLREGIEVKIYNADEIWTPVIERSDTFNGERVLTIKTRKRRSDGWGDRPTSDFTVAVKIDKATWDGYRDRFLDLGDLDPSKVVDIKWRGRILTDVAMIGRVYSKGIFVCERPNLLYGYDFNNLDLDRDRRMVDDWDLSYQIAYLMRELVTGDDAETWIETAYLALAKGSTDLSKLGNVIDSGTAELISARFAADHGSTAVPVANTDEATKVSFYGLHGVVVPEAFRSVLSQTFGTIDDILRKAIDTSGSYVTLDSMTDVERMNWRKAIALLDYADVADTAYLHNNVKCYEYSAPDSPLGTHHGDEERINRSLLGDLRALISTMVHELAHRNGRDGTLAHRASEEKMFEAVMGVLLDMAGTDWLLD